MNRKDTWKLVELSAYFDQVKLSWFLKAVYEVEEDYATKRVTIPRIYLPIVSVPTITHSHACSPWDFTTHSIDIGFGELDMFNNDAGIYCVEETIEERAEEVTMDDIEKKFGHKIKIVKK